MFRESHFRKDEQLQAYFFLNTVATKFSVLLTFVNTVNVNADLRFAATFVRLHSALPSTRQTRNKLMQCV